MMRSIRVRLYIAFGALTALIFLVVAFEANGMRELGRTIDRLAGSALTSAEALTRLGKLAADIRIADGRAILADGSEARIAALGDARVRAARFQREVDLYAALVAGEQEQALYRALLTRADGLVRAQADLDRQFAEAGGDPAQWYRSAGRAAYDQAQAAIEALIVETERRAAADVDAARQETRGLSLIADGMLGVALLVALLAVIYPALHIVEPLARLTAAMRRLAEGDWAIEIPATERSDEIGAMARAIQALRRQGMAGEQAATALRALNADLERLAMIDPLTGVANRRYFYQRAAIEIVAAHRRRCSLACLMLDIDFFKAVNDRYGHAAGDLVLKQVAQVVLTGIRPYDLLGRLGGEEFAVLLLDAGPATAAAIGERLRAAVAGATTPIDGTPLSVTISIGVGCLGTDDVAVDPLLDRADRALYEAKRRGRNQVVGPEPMAPPAVVSER
ncbi:hypothetical protein GCM10011611_24670 [Aliidongia dinghuensis]|uniref:diguanylate cyclase n=1 Tax=Aliidongia dinghuensis TaxID=1867774 RepID=A0A8J2YUS6_9PROT|nr:GGDEF domain-containing protein [Aliidongia dinghuensis]GGF17870.1 hypothetical protein GCM10011611_24670 [Aliidongia dinghuensis]